ncbi:putative subunit Sec66 of preprotein translocase [Hamiltosporidium tvaerminnensis]|uniref:Putative subunit Sec66 of preprotein translocase n=1 Tax=Hamiltosporidium tvaerminnensis TaxID=1176355 RepID=A0A4Q9LQL9_9MICR|nr:putative subunit Sec66 of preprotein translocase [Hamiltosporidium tvaerminnensis]
MLQIIFVCLSLTIVTLSYVKSKNKNTVTPLVGQNTELEKFYILQDQGANHNILMKQLQAAALFVTENVIRLSEERSVLYDLYSERMISYLQWKNIEKTLSRLSFEKMSIESEVEALKNGWSSKMFGDCEKEVSKNLLVSDKLKKENRNNEDSFYLRKREVLEREVVRRLKENNREEVLREIGRIKGIESYRGVRMIRRIKGIESYRGVRMIGIIKGIEVRVLVIREEL